MCNGMIFVIFTMLSKQHYHLILDHLRHHKKNTALISSHSAFPNYTSLRNKIPPSTYKFAYSRHFTQTDNLEFFVTALLHVMRFSGLVYFVICTRNSNVLYLHKSIALSEYNTFIYIHL